jgi:hypothetical protein
MSTVVAVVAVAIAIAFVRLIAWDWVGATTGALIRQEERQMQPAALSRDTLGDTSEQMYGKLV